MGRRGFRWRRLRWGRFLRLHLLIMPGLPHPALTWGRYGQDEGLKRAFSVSVGVSNSATGEVHGPEAVKEPMGWLRSAFPDTSMTIEDQVSH